MDENERTIWGRIMNLLRSSKVISHKQHRHFSSCQVENWEDKKFF